MAIQARFVIRPEGPKGSTLLLGMNFPKNSCLEPGVIYEIDEILGDLVIRAVKGKPAMPEGNWGYTINDILETSDGSYILTEEEYKVRQEMLEKKKTKTIKKVR